MNKLKLTKLIILQLCLIFVFSLTRLEAKPNFTNQHKVDELVQTAIYYYWHGGDYKDLEKAFFKGITLKGKYDIVENSFKEAIKLEPNRLDLRFSLASTQIIEGKTTEALKTYQDILALNPNDFNAQILLLAYNKALNNHDEYNKIMQNLNKDSNSSLSVKQYIKKFNTTSKLISSTKFNQIASNINADFIVILGYALNKDGTMADTLVNRLKQGLAAAKLNKNAKIIVTGGVPKQGVTEAFLMKNWLVANGLAPEQIIIEDEAKDTVANALYSTAILKKYKAKKVILVSSATHMRRALSLFKEAAANLRLKTTFSNLVYMDYSNKEEANSPSLKEKIVIYRDLIRTSGIWAYPGIQR